jgi:hypothetical protein
MHIFRKQKSLDVRPYLISPRQTSGADLELWRAACGYSLWYSHQRRKRAKRMSFLRFMVGVILFSIIFNEIVIHIIYLAA